MQRPALDQSVTFLYTHDLAASQRFYAETLGLLLVLDQGACRIYQLTPTSFIGICAGRAPQPDGIIITLVSDAVDDWYDQLRAQGVAFEKPPAFNPQFNIYHCFLRDPSGYLIEIQQFRDPRWPQAGTQQHV